MNAIAKDIYTDKEHGNVRYQTSSEFADQDGWCYLFTRDESYAERLASQRYIEVKDNYGRWVPFDGQLLWPTQDDVDVSRFDELSFDD